MRNMAIILLMLLLSLIAGAQVAAPATTRTQPAGIAAPQPALTPFNPLLGQVEQVAQTINLDLSRLRIEKWKADSAVKKQLQENANSVSRNLTAALPTIVDQVRANPQSLAAAFKLYRNLDALYDVFAGLTESAGAFGPKGEYETLANDAANLDKVRRAMGEKLESAATTTDTEITRLRAEVAQANAAPPPPPKKIVVDDQEKPKKTVHKKTTKKPPESKPSGTASTPASPQKPQ